MDTEQNIKDDILNRANKLLYYNNLLIEQCESWLPVEEGNRNMEKRISENMKMKQQKLIKEDKAMKLKKIKNHKSIKN